MTDNSPQSTKHLSMISELADINIKARLMSLPAKILFLRHDGTAAAGGTNGVPVDGTGTAVARMFSSCIEYRSARVAEADHMEKPYGLAPSQRRVQR